jgi:hypothetical protein
VSACGSKRRGTRAGVSASAIETDSATSYGLCGHPFLPAILLSIECAKNRMWLKAYLVRTLSGPRDVGSTCRGSNSSQTFHALQATVASSDSSLCHCRLAHVRPSGPPPTSKWLVTVSVFRSTTAT